MDIDITGPNVPKMLGIDDAELHVEDGQIFPAIGPHGLKVISMAFQSKTQISRLSGAAQSN